MTLADLAPGESGIIVSISAEGILRQRLLDLGLVPRTFITACFASRGGDPVAYAARGAVLALRLSTASKVIITPARRYSQ